MTNPTPSDEQLARYLSDEMSAEERARVDAWSAADTAHHAELERLRVNWQRSGSASDSAARWNVDRAWSRVDAQLESGATVIPLKTRPAWHQQAIWRAAAALLLVAGAGSLWRDWFVVTESAEQRFVTSVGTPRDIVLADSTHVTLGPSSTLRVLAAYGARERVVELVGEASFQVRHDAARPFSVRAAGTITQDIGTEFVVRAVEGDTMVRVTVYEGIASFRRDDAAVESAVTLRAHDVGVLTAGSATVRTQRDSSRQVAWRDGQLTFEAATLAEVASELRRWYPVVITMPDTLVATRHVSATLPTRDLAEALEILRLALRIDIVQRGDTVHVR